MTWRYVIAIVAITVAAGAKAGPFGLEMGTPLSKLVVEKQLKENAYQISVPKTNSDFGRYLAIVTPEDGLCKILAIGVDHPSDAQGVMVREIFAALTSVLSGKYGAPKTYDMLETGALWTAPSAYAMSLFQGERTLTNAWAPPNGLPDNIQSIMLEANATSASSTHVTLSYEFNNLQQCVTHEKAKDNGAL